MQLFYFFFHEHEQYAKYVQQVVAINKTLAQFKMNDIYPNQWSNMLTQDEFETLIKQNNNQYFKPFPPLY